MVRMRRRRQNLAPWDMISIEDHDDGADLTQQLLLGVEYADGRATTSLPRDRRSVPAGTDAPVLLPAGGGGGQRSYDQGLWLSPLPASGRLRVVCAWAAVGIAETHSILDGTAIATAGSRAEVLWPRGTDGDLPPRPAEPPSPLTRWFAEHSGQRP